MKASSTSAKIRILLASVKIPTRKENIHHDNDINRSSFGIQVVYQQFTFFYCGTVHMEIIMESSEKT